MPIAVDEVEKVPGRLSVRVFSFKNENDQVTGRDEFFSDLLVMRYNAVGSGSIHHGDVAQNIYRQE